ncbi:flagellar motor protein MotB [Roseibium polysiphoniae]|uniref:Flagellar motor protein MotB n=1 Tax=Roseibium polysiphoniae TaxID=2571221 RepID=A0A944CBX1_9HYPH|nr:OmpA family protein [Roseibium polysiphoniae]MBS8259338.1 flagellar motor protein MotB [Roseibium polysiphoniae]
MRAQAKQVRREEEEESAFVSMTDMTVGFLFIMMILLAFFASQVRSTETVPRAEYEKLQIERNELRDLAETQAVTIVSLETANADLMRQIQKLEELIRQLRSQIDAKDATIDELRAELARLKEADPLEDYLSRVSAARRDVLTRLRDAILADFPDLKVELSEESDALRFQGEGLFASGSSELTPDKTAIVSKLAERLDQILPCFTLGETSSFDEICNPSYAMVEAVQIEGHTDNDAEDNVNRPLSANRANNTFFAMTNAAKGVMQHLNLKMQPVLSVAAYGADRPITSNDTSEGKATNRRIDLRFIMVTPQDTGGIQVIRDALQAVGEQP